MRPDSSSERALRQCLLAAQRHGAETAQFSGRMLDLPMYDPHVEFRAERAVALIEALRAADAVVVASPGYHGAVSGLVKNALDYVEDLRDASRVYLDGTPWGCISCAYGWQAAVGTLGQLRTIGHALRAWPTPVGVAINSSGAVWNDDGTITDHTVSAQLELLATQLVKGVVPVD